MQFRSPKFFILSLWSKILVVGGCRGKPLWEQPSSCPTSDQSQLQLLQKGPNVPRAEPWRDTGCNSGRRLKKRQNSCKLQLRERSEKTREKQPCSQQGQCRRRAGGAPGQSRSSLQTRRGPQWSRLYLCCPQQQLEQIYTEHLSMRSFWRSPGYSRYRVTTKEWWRQIMDWQQPPFLICLHCSGEDRKGWAREGVFTLLFILTALVCYHQAIN